MIILKDYLGELLALVQETPELLDLPLVYSSDDEGNSFHYVNNHPTRVNVRKEAVNSVELEDNNGYNALIMN